MDYPFRSSAFGGFNKQDVLSFLDAQLQQFGAARQELQDELDAARQELAELRQERHELELQMEKERQELEMDGQKRADTSVCLEQMEQERDAAWIQVEQLVRERDELQRQLEAVQPAAQAYAELKERTACVELDAHRRAQSIQDEAEREAQEVRRQVEQWLQRMEREYTAVCGQAKDAVSQAAGHLEKIGAELGQINALLNGEDDALERMRRIYAAAAPGHAEAPTLIEGECKGQLKCPGSNLLQ